ncbi:hypothetical protein RclHR1_11300006 [Rhizophagus clarus]|uniref:RRM domain-containing protein n=1 Tax=Rhizophagus clarus TaxID=94130 RepID=A0A2Z6Q451_9GLOM|nr:hypothetical protein RclHR1_11300006 [Rhizophagus clarus]GES82274.1 hypothetical protein GLOIN_2v1715746 [Rhizophagus clarus]
MYKSRGAVFSEIKRHLFFYDIPNRWTEKDIHEALSYIGYVVSLSVRTAYKYKSAKVEIHLTHEADRSYRQGAVNTVLKTNKNDPSTRILSRWFDANHKFYWQATRDLDKLPNKANWIDTIDKIVKQHGAIFGKIITVHKKHYVLLYFENDKKLNIAINNSKTKKELGEILTIKGKNELIGRNGTYIYNGFTQHKYKKNKNKSTKAPKNTAKTEKGKGREADHSQNNDTSEQEKMDKDSHLKKAI